MKRFGFLGGALVLSASVAACLGNGDDNSSTVPRIDSGVDASTPGDAGEDANTPEMDANSPEAGADATLPAEAGVDGGAALPEEASTDAGLLDAGDAGARAYALFVGTDFSNAELAAVALGPDAVAGQLSLDDQDSVPYASGGLGFVMEHTLGKVIVLDRARPWTATKTIDINDVPDSAAQYASNPRAVLVTTGTKAYVARYASNVIQIVDVASGAVTGSLDLSAFVGADDTDGLVDVQDAAYDPATGRAYFLLQRINQFDYGPAPDYVAACLTTHGAIVGVDVAHDTILDLNGDAAAGTAIELLGDNPGSLTLDVAGGRLIVPETGCYVPPDPAPDGGPAPRVGRGVEAVSLATGTAAWLYRTDLIDRLQGLVWVDGTHAYVQQGSEWFAWNPTQTTLGSTVADFPQAPVSDGTGRVVGLAYGTPSDAGPEAGPAWSVVALDVASSHVTTIGPNPFHNVVPASGYGVAGALLH